MNSYSRSARLTCKRSHGPIPAIRAAEAGDRCFRQEHSSGGYACFGMNVPSQHLLRALRQAQLYGYLVIRHDRLYLPGGNRALCSLHDANEMVRSGWLAIRDGKYEITP